MPNKQPQKPRKPLRKDRRDAAEKAGFFRLDARARFVNGRDR